MGATLLLQIRDEQIEDLPDIRVLLNLEKRLEKISKKLKIPSLCEFSDYKEVEESISDYVAEIEDGLDEEDIDEERQVEEDWFDPVPALAAIQKIRDHLKENPADLKF